MIILLIISPLDGYFLCQSKQCDNPSQYVAVIVQGLKHSSNEARKVRDQLCPFHPLISC
jgi:hypothetical protein